MAFKYLTKDVLSGFDKYKYCSVDTSPVSNYVMHPFWNWLVQFYPLWIAPNVLTFAGFLLLILQFFVFTYFDNYFYASDDTHPEYPPFPNWVWLFAANCMFWAHQLDGTDGKQARRTKTSSPLGELFDHGLDSWATLFMPIGLYSVFGRGEHSLSPERTFMMLVAVMVMFFTSHWEKYNTGVLYLPWGYDVSQLVLTSIYLVTFIFGYQVWKFTVPVFGMSSGKFFELLMQLSVWGFGIPVSIWNSYVSYRDKTGKNLPLCESIRPLVPVILEFGLFIIWANCSSCNILNRHPRLFYVAMGTIFSNIACRCIVSGMSNTRCQAFNWLLIPLIAIVIGILTIHLGVLELYLLSAYCIFVTAAHIHYGICVVKELSEHLNIYVFSIERPVAEASSVQ